MDSCVQDAGFRIVVDGEGHHSQDESFQWLAAHHNHDHGHDGCQGETCHGVCHHQQHQHIGDPMDIDFEFDSLSWTDELDHPFAATDVDLDLGLGLHESTHAPPHQPAFGAVPLDFLFAEDEAAFPGFVNANQMSDAHMHDAGGRVVTVNVNMMSPPIDIDHHWHPAELDPTPERLRNQLSLLSEGSCGDEIVFKNCDSTKAMLLHSLAMEFRLNYTHDAPSGEVSVTRTTTEAPMPFRPDPPTIVLAPPFQGLGFPSEVSIDTGSLLDDSDAGFGGSQQLVRRPSRSQRISDSISKHVSTWKTSMSKGGGRRGPLTEDGRRDMKVLEGAGGACWRCKVLRRKCDPGTPCRCCLQSVPMPHLGDDAPLWPFIGCRRGPLRDALPVQVLCPALLRESKQESEIDHDDYRPRRSLDIADRCLLSAQSQRLSDMKAVLECASYKLSISDPAARQSFVSFVEAGRYRNLECLHKELTIDSETVSYSELIATIAWDLAENQGVLALLEMGSWDHFMSMLETACIYESEVGQTSLVMMSMICLRHCLEALRLHSAGFLTTDEHVDCMPGQCQVQCIQDLSYYVEAYISELSSVVFNKENMRDRRWWLSTFYSLYIQSYVRHALMAIEKQLCFDSADDTPVEDLTSSQYLHLAAVLFTAASAKYDPLLGGRLQYALTENSVIPETSVPELHHSSARVACAVDKWPEAGVKTSYQFLRQLLQIGSLDFVEEQGDTLPIRTSISSGRLTPETLRPSTASHNSITSQGTANQSSVNMIEAAEPPQAAASLESPACESVASPKKQAGNTKRWSAETKLSMWSASSVSNASSLSLARTFESDVTSILEEPELEEGSSSNHVDDLGLETPPIPAADAAQATAPGGIAEPAQGVGLAAQYAVSACFVCHCCPRTPQRFRTAEDLTKHEAEKPHPCPRCKRRFKSPAEADRHTKAVHIKSHFWTCKAMENPLVVFHQETYDDGAYDICGFCGGGFAQPKDDNGEERRMGELVVHLEKVHHHGACNRDKEFYRVDNFRQHLKTAHVAKQGKWLKDLEARCRTTTASGEGRGAEGVVG